MISRRIETQFAFEMQGQFCARPQWMHAMNDSDTFQHI